MTTVKEYLAWAAGQVGRQEKPKGSNLQPYAALAGHANGYAWCASFLVAGARVTGLQLPPGADTASCALNEAAFKRAGRLYTKPQPGDFLFVYFPSLQRAAHTGVVVAVDGAYVRTVEGNSNDEGAREGYEVCRRRRFIRRPIGGVGIRSFGRPLYTATSTKAPLKPPAKKPIVKPAPRKPLPDPLEALMALPADERKQLLEDLGDLLAPRVVDGLLSREIQLGPAAARELGSPTATVTQLLQAGPAVATDVRQAVADLDRKLTAQ